MQIKSNYTKVTKFAMQMDNPQKIEKELQEIYESAFSLTQDGDMQVHLQFLEKMTAEYFVPCYGLFVKSVFYNLELRLQKILEEVGDHSPWQEKFPDQYERFKKLKYEPNENLRAALAEILTKALLEGSKKLSKVIE
jgi:hypothetical protein